MTEKELAYNLGIKIEVFEDALFPDEAFYIPALKTMFLSDAISEDKTVFNYLVFMEKYNLKTIADETMVKEEYLALVN